MRSSLLVFFFLNSPQLNRVLERRGCVPSASTAITFNTFSRIEPSFEVAQARLHAMTSPFSSPLCFLRLVAFGLIDDLGICFPLFFFEKECVEDSR